MLKRIVLGVVASDMLKEMGEVALNWGKKSLVKRTLNGVENTCKEIEIVCIKFVIYERYNQGFTIALLMNPSYEISREKQSNFLLSSW